QVSDMDPSELLRAGLRQARLESAAVGGAAASLEEALRLQAVCQAGQAAAAEAESVGQLGHAYAGLARFLHAHQDPVLGEAEAIRRQFDVESPGKAAVAVEETPPGVHLDCGQVRHRRSSGTSRVITLSAATLTYLLCKATILGC